MINILRELIKNKKGRIEGVSMPDILQLIWLEKMTCQLQVKCNGQVGTLNILEGELKNAKTKKGKGKDAAMEILSWENVKIELDNNADPTSQTLKVSTEEMLMENFQRREDKKKDSGKIKIANSSRQKSEKDKGPDINVAKLNKAVDSLKEKLGEALLATDIWSGAGMRSIAGWNIQPDASALFGQIIQSTNQVLEKSGYSNIYKYGIFDLVDGNMAVLIPIDEYAWGMLVNGKIIKLGLLLNVVLPEAIAAFEDAITGK